MSLNEILHSGLKSIPGCRSVCYVDMSARLVLASKSHKPQPQEVYDAIAGRAVCLLQNASFTSVITNTGGAARALLFGQSDVQVFVQTKNDPDHALCCLCDIEVDPEVVTNKMEEIRQDFPKVF